jgi:RHS repeat-associated protein
MRALIHPALAAVAAATALLSLTAMVRAARGHGSVVSVMATGVTPNPATSPARPANSNGYTASFTVTNNNTHNDTFTLSCVTSSNVTCTGVSPSVVTLSSGASTNVNATYNVGAGGSGWLQLCAEGTYSVGCGQQTIPVTQVQVTPDGVMAAKRLTYTGPYHETFTITNTGTTPATYTLACSGSANVPCTGVTRSSLTLAGGAHDTASANYNVRETGTGTLTLTASAGTDSDPGSYLIPVISYSVAVTPDSGEAYARRQNYAQTVFDNFLVTNTGTDSDTYTFSCTGSANITCLNTSGIFGDNPSPTSKRLGPGGSVSVTAGYTTGAAGTGRLTLGAAGVHASDQGWFWVPVTSKTAGVTPQNASIGGVFAGSSYSQSFTVTNTDVVSHKYWIDCAPGANVTCGNSWPVLPESLQFQLQQSVSFAVAYSITAGSSGPSNVQLTVNDHYATGTANFTIWPNVPHAVSVTPANGTGPTRSSFTNSDTAVFTVQNVGTSSDTYTFTCTHSANVTCISATPSSATMGSLSKSAVTVIYNVGASGSASVGLQASNANANNTGQLTFTVVPAVSYGVVVTPDAKPIGVLASTSATYPFAIRNTGTVTDTYTVVAACSGAAIASGCTPSATSVILAGQATSTVAVSYTSGTSPSTGQITLTAKESKDASLKDSGWVTVATGTAQAPTVALSTVNPGTTVERDLCLTIALVGSAAAECGDLRLAHGLPAVRTMGRARAPTLVYSSAYAHPYPLLAAEVTLPAGAANPDSVEVVLHKGGDSVRARWAGSAFSPGRTNRVVIGWDRLNDTTGVYSYTLDVANIYPASRLSASPAPSGEYVVVNRSQSEFGAGWWLAGLERLRLDSMLWIGGDGSARVYRATGITNVWAGPPVMRPDTLKKVGTEYVRLLPARAEVWFDAQGRHVRTVSRLRHDTTLFHRNVTTGKLDSITVAPASQALRYKFVYNATTGVLDSVIAPPAGSILRAAKLTKNGSQITAIRDPDTSTVSFGYDGGFANRINSRTDRVGTVTSYFFDAAGKVARDSLDPGSSQPVMVSRLRAYESAGFIGTPALDTAIAPAAFDGPRTDVGDSTLFWLNGLGAPRRIRNPLGFETNVQRQDPTFAALVTRTQGPNGRVMRATYDGRGHVLTTTDSGTIVNGQVAVTRHGWNAAWDADTLVVPPEGDSTVIGIDASTGNRLWQQDASGSRVNFGYDAATGLLLTIQEPGTGATTTLSYDLARGNLARVLSPLGFRDSTYRDALGRDTLEVTPIDSGQTKVQRKRTVYDLQDRVTRTETRADSMGYRLSGVTPDPKPVSPDTAIVVHIYDKEGRDKGDTTLARPDSVSIDRPIWESRTFDRAGRILSKRLGSGPTSFTYDAAGNAVTETYRAGFTVSAQFDAVNRVTQRVVPRRAWARTDCTGHPAGPLGGTPCLMKFPYYPNLISDSLEVAADTLVFAYDSAGNMVRADNRDAHVRRTYYQNGLLATDSLWLRDYSDNSFGTAFAGLRYGYDRDGRRSWLKLPLALAGAGTDSMAYAYSPANGALIRVRDGSNRRDSLTYTPAGRLDSLKVFAAGASSAGIREKRQYDLDGRMISRERRTGANAVLQSDGLSYDARGNIVSATTSSAALFQGAQTITTAYDGLGPVVASQVTNSVGAWDLEEFRTDALGNVWYQHVRHSADQTAGSQRSYYAENHLLSGRSGALPTTCNPPNPYYLDTLYQTVDGAGNVIRTGEEQRDCNGNYTTETATNSYYSADNRLAAVQRYVNGGSQTGSWEEYRYDALGRRVLTRARRDAPDLCNNSTVCVSFVERTVWDGDQVLHEQQSSQLDGMAGGPPNYGTVGYAHVLGIDQPVHLMDGRVIHYNWRGLGEASSWADGTTDDCQLGTPCTTTIAWPAGQGVYYRRATDPNAGVTITWIGNLPANGANTTGQLYRRNRYYDAAAGRFTQEDPIGLAGGLNLYGFAAGDPVNFSDPFGLCEKIKDTKAPCILFAVVAGEAGGASSAFQTGVANVIKNRADLVGGDYDAVINQPGAFGAMDSDDPAHRIVERVLETGKVSAQLRDAVEGVYRGTLGDNTQGALFYYSPVSMKPGMASNPRRWDFARLTLTAYSSTFVNSLNATLVGGEGLFFKCVQGTSCWARP